MAGDRAERARRERHETPTEQLDRDWADLLQELVSAAQLCAVAGLVLRGLAVTGVVLLIFTVAADRSYGVIAATITAVVFAGLWAALPLALRRCKQTDENPAG